MVDEKKNKDVDPVADNGKKSPEGAVKNSKLSALSEALGITKAEKGKSPANKEEKDKTLPDESDKTKKADDNKNVTNIDLTEAFTIPESQLPKKRVSSDIIDDSQDDASQGQNLFQVLFANGNKIVTLEDGPVSVDSETRHMLALFSDGTYIVDEAHKYDGKVLNFVATMKRRKVPIGAPKYYSAAELAAIYAYAERGMGQINISAEESSDYQMQIDFLSVISKAAMHKVSDIHVVVADSTVILFRINGMMERELEYSHDWGEAFVRAAFASADISDANYAKNEFQGAQKLGSTPLRGTNGKLRLPHNILAIRLQFNPIAFGSQYLVMRLLYADDNPNGESDLRSLGLGSREIDLFYRLRANATGLKIIAGPTGSGKSTTLQRNMIKLIQEHKGELNVITVEDPPEYPIPGARQMPVTNASTEEEKDEEFTKALSAALRSDPDVLMVGEIRTLSAASLVFRGALSGHSVWTTLHANSAPAIITRLRDMGVRHYMLEDPEIMKGLVSQRLFRKICPYCRIPIKEEMSRPSYERLKIALGDYGIENTYLRGPGCRFCEGKGVIGRMSVPEIILPDAHFLQLMIDGKTKEAIDYWVSELNGRPLRDAAIERMLKGYIDIDEVERWCGLLDQRPVY